MRRLAPIALLLASTAVLPLSSAHGEPPMAGGDTTLVLPPGRPGPHSAFSRPATNMRLTRRDAFFVGNSFFRNAWVTAPSSTQARDGLGPLFNTSSCQSCHVRDGKGAPPKTGEDMISMLVRISIPAKPRDADTVRVSGVVPEPTYGAQIQNHSIPGVPTEAKVVLEWVEIPGQFPDGTKYSLRKPQIRITKLAHGPIARNVQTSPRVAPAMIGLGLLDTIPVAQLQALEDADDSDNDGISGRLNQVWDVASRTTVAGRFGWKAEQPSVRQQVAGAFAGDIGVTSSLFPNANHTGKQRAANRAPHGGKPEVTDEILDFVTFYAKTLAVPAQRSTELPAIVEGDRLFRQAGCHSCHVDTFTTGHDPKFPELSGQTIHPYSDLLLHDMGEGLADDRPTFAASGREWRTPPLWGVGLVYVVNNHSFFLHDGRARDLEEAILWHGGEAEASKNAYMRFAKAQRRKLVAFVRSL